jgi:hypothetical protein
MQTQRDRSANAKPKQCFVLSPLSSSSSPSSSDLSQDSGATVQKPVTPTNDKKVKDRAVVLKWTDWFYGLYLKTVGGPSPDAPMDGRRTVQDQNAAKALEKLTTNTSDMEPQAAGWLRGDYFKSAGSTLAGFKAVLGSLTPANAKPGRAVSAAARETEAERCEREARAFESMRATQ